jgi:hypothetical protein
MPEKLEMPMKPARADSESTNSSSATLRDSLGDPCAPKLGQLSDGISEKLDKDHSSSARINPKSVNGRYQILHVLHCALQPPKQS